MTFLPPFLEGVPGKWVLPQKGTCVQESPPDDRKAHASQTNDEAKSDTPIQASLPAENDFARTEADSAHADTPRRTTRQC